MSVKKGDSFWGFEIEVSSITYYEYVVTKITKSTIYLVAKVVNCTWVKKTSKHFDWGWADNIDRCWRYSFSSEEELKKSFSSSRIGAEYKALKDLKKRLRLIKNAINRIERKRGRDAKKITSRVRK